MKELIYILITGIICITILQAIALVQGIDGNLYGLSIAGISGITGIGIDHFYKKFKLKLKYGKEI